MGSKVAEFYNGKNIFITGATGFLGSCLIEKLLRSTDINNIYVLIRPKKGKQINERLEELTKNSVIIFFITIHVTYNYLMCILFNKIFNFGVMLMAGL